MNAEPVAKMNLFDSIRIKLNSADTDCKMDLLTNLYFMNRDKSE
jgi:hypothetical protein